MDSLKHNLYEILNVSKNATQQKIKEQFIHLTKMFHPDKKHTDLENEIYSYITIAYNILSDIEKRKNYDNFINTTQFNEFKKNYQNDMINFDYGSKQLPDDGKQKWDILERELNEKHGYYKPLADTQTLLQEYKNQQLPVIEKLNISNMSEFNDKFHMVKITENPNMEIVTSNDLTKELSTYVNLQLSNFAEINDLDKLYINDTDLNNHYQPIPIVKINEDDNKVPLDVKMEDYIDDNIHTSCNRHNFQVLDHLKGKS